MQFTLPRLRLWSQLVLGRRAAATDSERRYARLGQAVATGLAGRALGAAVSFISVPLTVRYLGGERYGLWMAIGGVLTWLSFADLGLGNSLINAVAEAHGKADKQTAQRHVASVFWLLTAIGAAVALAGFVVIESVDWAAFFKVGTAQARAEVTPALRAAFVIFVLQFPLAIVPKILTAHQELRIANVWAAAGNLLSLLSLITVIVLHGGLVALILAFSGTTTLCSLLSAIWLFWFYQPHLRPKPSLISRASLRQMAHLSWMFFTLSLSAIFLFQAATVIISHYHGPQAVTPYSITVRLFSLALLPQSMIFTALWPTYTEALVRNDLPWVRRTFFATMKFTLLLNVAVSVGFIIGGQFFIRHWAGPAATPSLAMILLLSLWFTSASAGGVAASFLNGAGHVRIQVLSAPPAALASVAASVLAAPLLGAEGVVLAMVVAYTLGALTPAMVRALRLVNGRVPYGRPDSRPPGPTSGQPGSDACPQVHPEPAPPC